jgi:hypothetical protein
MTAVCVGGVASQAKSGYGLTVDLTNAALVARFANTAGWFSAIIAAALAGAHYELSSFCSNDPPAQPTLTGQDFVDALSVANFEAKRLAEKKILDWVGAHVWYDLCECTSGAAPTPPTYQTDPGNLPQINPPAVNIPLLVTPCKQYVAGPTFPGGFIVGIGPVTTLAATANISIYADLTTQIVGGTRSGNWTIHAQWLAAGTILRDDNLGVFPATPNTVKVSVPPAGVDSFRLTAATQTGVNTTDSITAVIREYCNGDLPTSTVQPCCPPDPVLVGQINQILQLVTIIQRQGVPFGYIASTSHTALSGAGAISISGILGVKVAVTTLPTSYGVAGTSPPEHFDLGFVTFGCADGFPSAFRLTRNPQVMMPARCGVYTDLDYDLAPGVVVTITELVREP